MPAVPACINKAHMDSPDKLMQHHLCLLLSQQCNSHQLFGPSPVIGHFPCSLASQKCFDKCLFTTDLVALSHCWSLLLQDADMRIGHIIHRKKNGKLPEDSAAGHDLEAAHLNGAIEAGKPVVHARTPSSHAHGPSVEAGMPVTHA